MINYEHFKEEKFHQILDLKNILMDKIEIEIPCSDSNEKKNMTVFYPLLPRTYFLSDQMKKQFFEEVSIDDLNTQHSEFFNFCQRMIKKTAKI